MEDEPLTSPRPRRKRAMPRMVAHLVAWAVILGVLVAWMLPALRRARESRNRKHCLGNLKHLGLALKQYSQDFDECYPWNVGRTDPDEAWRDLALLFPSYNSGWDSFFCPSSKDPVSYTHLTLPTN